MSRTLYVTYTEELKAHAECAMKAIEEKGWVVDDGTALGFSSADRLQRAKSADALILLSALRYTYNDVDGIAIHEREWDAAKTAGKPTRALIVDPKSNWPINQTERNRYTVVDAFHDKLKKTNPCEYFTEDPNSVVIATSTLVSLIESDIKSMVGVSVFVVWDTTIPGLELLLSHVQRRPPARMTVHVPALSNGVAGGHLLKDVVVKGIRDSDRVLVVADRPNANVAFEVGIALGLGKMIALVHFGAEVPKWLTESVFRGFVVSPVSSLLQLNRLLQSDGAWYKPLPAASVPLVGETLFLAPSRYVGEALREEQNLLFRDEWKTISESDIEVDNLPQRLGEIAQVVWSIASFSEGSDVRDGMDNAANAIIAGWFFARALKLETRQEQKRLRVLHQVQAREVVDVMGLAQKFRDLEEFAKLLRDVPSYDLPAVEPLEERSDNFLHYRMIRIPSEAPATSVWVGKYPVTNRQFLLFCEKTGHQCPPGMALLDPDEPATSLSYNDADSFCRASGLTLPSEALWRKFAMAGSTSRYWWGDQDKVLTKVAWHKENSGDRVQKVGQKAPNTWGLFDIFGNVWEWTEKYPETAAVDPRNSLEEVRQAIWKAKILGGAFNSPPTDLTSSQSLHLHESTAWIGFRCVKVT